ncbi:CGNR zinc finger domain-containing protein [Streptomyces sp. NPDC001793]|uniref:CGNR zinc finger domain-containing protein n=1 Tax=Streptomyces sp. NPDC001793 TaxID=3154657 RepID=UPI0033240B39
MDPLSFSFRSDRLCLDFAATLGRRGVSDIERLRSADELSRWCVMAGLLPELPAADQNHLAQARILREAVYRSVQHARSGRECMPQDIEEINIWAVLPPAPLRLRRDGRATEPVGSESVAHAFASVARDAVDLLTGAELERIGECQGEACSVLFVDRSRTVRRRWCSMNHCGNKAKKKTYRGHSHG